MPLVLRFGADLSGEEYSATIVAPLVKLYASPDRGTRMALLDQLPSYIDKLDKKTVSDKIFPSLVSAPLTRFVRCTKVHISANRIFGHRGRYS